MMNHPQLGSRAIICSALLVYGWIQPAASKLSLDQCEDKSVKSPKNPSDQNAQQPGRGCKLEKQPMMSPTPNLELFGIQWSNRSTGRLSNEMETVYRALIEQAQELANHDRITDAVPLIVGVPKNSRYYEIAQQLQENWSQELLHLAKDAYQQANLSRSLVLLQVIPTASSQHGYASQLQQQWRLQSAIFKQAISAQKTGNWQSVIDAIRKLQGTPLYQTLPAQELLQQAMINKFEPDNTLMKVAIAEGDNASASSVSANPALTTVPELSTIASLPGESVTGSPTIELEQALKWSNPTEQSKPLLLAKVQKKNDANGQCATWQCVTEPSQG